MISMMKSAVIMSLALVLLVPAAHAEESIKAPSEEGAPEVVAPAPNVFVDIPDDKIDAIMLATRPQVKNLKLNNTELVGEETAAEIADPLLTREQAEEAIVRGVVSSSAEWCKFDWKTSSFEPFMAEKRAEGRNEKQMAYTGLLHGYGMGIMEEQYKKMPCEEKHKVRIARFLYTQ